MTLLDFRDVTLARAEDEVSRELALRIPVSERLKQRMADAVIAHAEAVEADQLEADVAPPQRGKSARASWSFRGRLLAARRRKDDPRPRALREGRMALSIAQ